LNVKSVNNTRRQVLGQSLATAAAWFSVNSGMTLNQPSSFVAWADDTVKTLPNGVTYKVVKQGPGGDQAIRPQSGDLIAIRFAAYYGDVKIDDIFDTPEPYYTRVGSGGLVQGVEQAIPYMALGDRWVLTIPVCN